MYIPEDEQPMFGVVRTIFEDSTSPNPSLTADPLADTPEDYLDSDGRRVTCRTSMRECAG